MSPKDQRVAIAEASGFHPNPNNHNSEFEFWTKGGNQYGAPGAKLHSLDGHQDRGVDGPGLPDYLNDLNACHEMEKIIRPPHQDDYSLWDSYIHQFEEDPHANPAQRCKTFLKTLNLWK